MIDSSRGIIDAPSCTLSFNQMITYNDGMLATSVMRREGIGFSAAGALVSNGISEMRRRLNAERRLDMPRVGTFTLGDDGALEFTPADDLAANDVLAVFPSVTLPLTAGEEDSRHDEEAREARRADRHNFYLPLSRNIFRVAASLLMFISIGWLAFSTLDIDDGTARASFAPSPRADVQPAVTVVSDIIPAPAEPAADTAGSVTASGTTPEYAGPQLRNVDSDPYCLIIASLGSKSEVDRYMALNVDSVPLGVSHKAGRYRIYIATGRTIGEAMQQRELADISSRHPDAWVTHR